MSKFEYKAVPAPTRGTKAKGAKSTEDRFAVSITEALNEMAADGWEYVRAETLPCDERKGLTGTQTTYQNILIFKRFKQVAVSRPAPPSKRIMPRPSARPAATSLRSLTPARECALQDPPQAPYVLHGAVPRGSSARRPLRQS